MKSLQMNIGQKLLIAFFASILLPILIICIVLGFKISTQSQANFINSSRSELRQIDNGMTIMFEDLMNNIEMMASDPLIKRADETITTYKTNTTVTPMTPIQNGGIEAELYRYFERAVKSHPNYSVLGVGTRYGGYVQYPPKDRKPGYDPVARSWYKAALPSPGKVVMMGAYQSSSGSSIGVVRTIEDAGGGILGVISLDITLNQMTDIISDVRLGKTGYVMLVQDDGTIISDPRHPENNFKNLNELELEAYRTLATTSEGNIDVELNDGKMLANIYASPKLGWKFIGLIEKKEIIAEAYTLITVMITIGLILGAVFMTLASILARAIANPIKNTTELFKNIAHGEGDLTMRLDIQTNDEIGKLAHWFNEFVGNLEQIIRNVKLNAVQVDRDTHEVMAGSQGLSQATQEQASAIEEVAATVEEMTSSIKQNAENAENGRVQTREMVNLAAQSGSLSEELIKAMGEINESSRKIGEIITTVNDVAFQTNLLALNAAVEAARAGEHGKGFAVVAEEVRALAQRSAEAVNQVRRLIEDSLQKVSRGDTMVQQSGTALEEIISRIEALSNTMEEIAAASAEQASGVDEVNRAIGQIDMSTQQNAATVEELASTSDSLSNEARELAAAVERFKVSGIEA